MHAMRSPAAAVLCAYAATLTGCCSISRAFCGPDTSAWVSVDLSTPELAARTLLEALRRDEPGVVYDVLADELREELGLDQGMLELAWQKVRARYPYLHVAGYADVPPARVQDGGAAAAVVVAFGGERVKLDLVRQTYWELRYRRPGEDLTPAQRDARVGASLTRLEGAVEIKLDVEAEDDRSHVALPPRAVAHLGVDEIPVENVDFLGVFRAWKVRAITQLAP
jgi:hypothetical protein